MVLTRLKGGLGNQMFQYAAGKALAARLGTSLRMDLSYLIKNNVQNGDFISRPFELNLFPNIKETTMDYDFEALPYNIRRIAQKFRFPKIQRYNEYSFQFNRDLFAVKSPVLIDGYWQSEYYFREEEDAIRYAFTFPSIEMNDRNASVLSSIKNSEAISVHIRRGDYLNKAILEFNGICPLSYYEEGIAIMQQQFPDANYYFFSDDTEWVMKNLSHLAKRYTIVEGNYGQVAWKDMYLMSQCRHHIIANSSFSWWGAWLNTNNKKCVIAPKNWFANKDLQAQTINLCPATWKRI